MTKPYSVRAARPDEQAELTQLCVRATREAGHGDGFISRAMPVLTIALPSISAGAVQVIEHQSGAVCGVECVAPTAVHEIALLSSLYVDPPFWRQGLGRMLFEAAVARARTVNAGALIVYAQPAAAAFYEHLGAVRIGEVPFYFSPDVIMPALLYIIVR